MLGKPPNDARGDGGLVNGGETPQLGLCRDHVAGIVDHRGGGQRRKHAGIDPRQLADQTKLSARGGERAEIVVVTAGSLSEGDARSIRVAEQ